MPLPDTSAMYKQRGFVDLKRIPIKEPGRYLLKVTMKDNYAPTGTIGAFRDIEVPAPKPGAFAFSDLEFITSIEAEEGQSTMHKNGFKVVPFGMNAAFINQDELGFYIELYHTEKLFGEKPYYAQATILQGDRPLLQYAYSRKKQPAVFDVFSGIIAIRDLPSNQGDPYFLEIKLRNENLPEGQVLRQQFYVFNARMLQQVGKNQLSQALLHDLSDKETDYYLRSLIHISTPEEIRTAKALQHVQDKKNFLYSFWEKRSDKNRSVEALWKGHVQAIAYANDHFGSSLRAGWETDRGRVFLKYGSPSDVERYPYDNASLPHEIWKYDQLGTQSRVVFVFADTDMVTGEYSQIHSNKYGEPRNPTWQTDVVNRGRLKENTREHIYERRNNN